MCAFQSALIRAIIMNAIINKQKYFVIKTEKNLDVNITNY